MMDKEIKTSRLIELSGVINFRDFGGIQTKDGRRIKDGILFRSADLTDITKADQSFLEDFSVRTIFDYRTAEEANDRPDPQFPGVGYYRVAVNSENQDSYTSLDDLIGEDTDHLSSDILSDLYKNIPTGNRAYKQLMDLIKRPEDNLPLVHHCTGGRDRTGIGTMLILMVLDVEWETIVEDYIYSNITLKMYHENIFSQLSKVMSKQQVTQFKNDFLLKEEYITLSRENILGHYRSVDQFLNEEYGITEEIRKNIQDKCLE